MKKLTKEFILRLPLKLYNRIKESAEVCGVSVNTYCRQGLEGSNLFPPLVSYIQAQLFEEFGLDIRGICLFGSYTRGEDTSKSDIDVLVVLNSKIIIDRDIYDKVNDFKFDGREVSCNFVYLPETVINAHSLWLEVALDGLIVFDPRLEISIFLSELRRHITSGKVVRKFIHGTSYWVHQ